MVSGCAIIFLPFIDSAQLGIAILMPDTETVVLLLLCGIIVVWYDSMKVRELTLTMARKGCEEMSVSLLDDTVSLAHLGLKRDVAGRLRLRRVYEFRYLDRAQRIREGVIMILGHHPESFLMETDTTVH